MSTTPEQPQTEAERLAAELDEEAAQRVCNVAMAPASLLTQAAALLRALAEELAQARAALAHANEHTIPRLFQQRDQQWERAQGLAAELEGLKAQQWLPIESAPKDGSRVLLVIDHGQWGDKVWTGLWADGWAVSYGKSLNSPTHWRPLPAPPTGEVK